MIKENFTTEECIKLGKQEIFTDVWVAQDSGEFVILREVFTTMNNIGWTYDVLVSGFVTEQEAEEYIKEIFQ